MEEMTDKIGPEQLPELKKAARIETVAGTSVSEIMISEDSMKCWISIGKPVDDNYPEQIEIIEALKKSGIDVEYIIEDELERIVSEKIIGREVLIAEGQPPVAGKEGRVIYFFNRTDAPTLIEDDKGRINFKEIYKIQQVKKGDFLAELISPVTGMEGTTVKGEKVVPAEPKSAQLPIGINTEIYPENPNRLISSVDGVVRMSGNKIVVEQVVMIDGSVDYSTGNIKYSGDVVIKGELKAGFYVTAGGNVTVEGIVEDAVIECDGSVILNSGFIGKGTGYITAKKDITLKFIENQSVYAENNIYVEDSALNAKLEADGNIVVSGSNGVIGGLTSASDFIDTMTAGSQAGVETTLMVGIKRKTRIRIEEVDAAVRKNSENSNKVSRAILVLKKIQLLKSALDAKQEGVYRDLLKTRKNLKKEKEEFRSEKSELDKLLENVDNAVVKIQKAIYPGVNIFFGRHKRLIEKEDSKVVFRFDGEQIIKSGESG